MHYNIEDTMEYLNYDSFITNKYFKWYHEIIQKSIREERIYDSNCHEYHHSLPVSLGGTSKSIVILTFKEHYICHWLLTKFTKDYDKHKMILAMSFFYYNKINKSAKRPLQAHKSRAYSNFKKEFVAMRKETLGLNPEKNPFFKDEIFTFREIKSKKTLNCNRYTAAKNTPMEPNEISRLISRGIGDRKRTSSKGWDIWVEELSIFSSDIEKIINKRQEKVACEHCGIITTMGNHNRWHGKNCPSISETNKENRKIPIEKYISCKHCNKLVPPNIHAQFHDDKCKKNTIP
jgi:hypothetical protein